MNINFHIIFFNLMTKFTYGYKKKAHKADHYSVKKEL